MKIKLKHPWWTHLPALCLLAVAALFAMAEMPAKVPIHFGWDGKADGWGSPWELRLLFIELPLLALAVSFAIDELYCRYERVKSYNFHALFDEGIIGFLVGLEIATVSAVSSPNPVLKGELKLGTGLAIAAMAVAALLEFLRKSKPSPDNADEVSAPPPDELASLAKGKRWLHWETQNPLYLRLTMIAMLAIPLLMLLDKSCPHWLSTGMLCAMVSIFILFYGGMRVSVTPERLSVRFGIFGVPLLNIPFGSILSVKEASFNPIGDFGGWGIRYSLSKKTWAYILYGSRGVELKSAAGKTYVIGSDDANRLAAVCQAALRVSSKEASV